MKDEKRKARIREMLKAEGLIANGKVQPNADWTRFKREINAAESQTLPQLQITGQKSKAAKHWLLPLAALAIIGVVFFGWFARQKTEQMPQLVQKPSEGTTAARTLSKGEVYRSGKREIRLLAGNAQLTDSVGKVRIVANELTADFRLRERVDMQIEHPLLTVTITGTEFLYAVTASRGKIELRHGSLAIDFKHPHKEESISLKAPATLSFTASGHVIKTAEKSVAIDGKPLYRYELLNGETFYAYQMKVGPIEHHVQLLGGKAQTIYVKEIAQVSIVERE